MENSEIIVKDDFLCALDPQEGRENDARVFLYGNAFDGFMWLFTRGIDAHKFLQQLVVFLITRCGKIQVHITLDAVAFLYKHDSSLSGKYAKNIIDAAKFAAESDKCNAIHIGREGVGPCEAMQAIVSGEKVPAAEGGNC